MPALLLAFVTTALVGPYATAATPDRDAIARFVEAERHRAAIPARRA